MNRAHQCSGSAAGPLIVFEPCNNVTTRGQVSLLSNPIITQKDWYTPPPEWKHHKKWYPSVLIHADSLVLPTPTSNYILSHLSQFVLTKPHYLSEFVFLDIHRNAMVFKPYHMMWNERGLEEVYELLGADQIQVCFSDWEAISSSFHTSTFATFHTIWMGEKTSTRHETDHRMDKNSGPAATLSFGRRKWALPLTQTHLAALSPKWQQHC